MSDQIRLGIVGANPASSWAAGAHLPALSHFGEFTVTAVATTREATAQDAAAAFNAAHAFTSAAELANCADVDLVVVAVKSADHAAVVRAALAAGKHVFCEWPLGTGVHEAALAAAAGAARTVNAIGLQGYHSPGVRYVRDLLAEGRVESVAAVVAGDPLGGSRIPASMAWSTDSRQGTTLLSIMGGHTIAVLEHVAGRLTEVSAILANRNEQVQVAETGEHIANNAAGQAAFAGTTATGTVVSVAVQGGNSTTGPDGFFVRICGTEGALIMTPARRGTYLNWAELNITVTCPDGTHAGLPVPDRYRLIPDSVPAGPPANVAALYREIGQAIFEGRSAQPDFAAALHHHRVLAAIERASVTGTRQAVTGPHRDPS